MKSLFCASAFKPSSVSPLGIRLWAPPTPNAPVLLVHIDDHGLFAGKLKMGMQITQINEIACEGATAADVEAYLAQLVGGVTIWACAPQPFSRAAPAAATTPHSAPSSVCGAPPTPSVPDLTESDSSHDDDDSLSLESVTLEDDFAPECRMDNVPNQIPLYDQVVSFLF